MTNDLLKPAPSPGKRAAVILAVAVHLALVAFLFYGVRWQSRVAEPVEVEIVRVEPAIVAPPAAEAPPEAQPEPPPEPKPEPAPVEEAKPPAKPVQVVKPPPKADIERKEKTKPPKETAPKTPAKPRLDPLRRQLDEEIKQTAERTSAEAIAQDQAKLKAAANAALMSRSAKAWMDKINAKIKGNIVRPANVGGNPKAVFEVALLPDGSLVGEPQLKESTGIPTLDAAIERAIKKSDPLPKPDDPAVFERSLRLTFWPLKD